MGSLPGDEPSSYTRSFTLTRDQADLVDAAIDTAKANVEDQDGNANGNALAWICGQVTA